MIVHLLRLEQGGKRWCSCKEVANFQPHWGGKDLVNIMLKAKTEDQNGPVLENVFVPPPTNFGQKVPPKARNREKADFATKVRKSSMNSQNANHKQLKRTCIEEEHQGTLRRHT